MSSIVCGRCGEECRLASVPGGTAWVHQPGSPGHLDRHWAVPGRLATVDPRTYRYKAELAEEKAAEDENALTVIVPAYLVLPNDLPPDAVSPQRLVNQLHAVDCETECWLAVATRGGDRTIASIGLKARHRRNRSRIAAMWLHDDGLKNPAWKFESCLAWGPNRVTEVIGASRIRAWLIAA